MARSSFGELTCHSKIVHDTTTLTGPNGYFTLPIPKTPEKRRLDGHLELPVSSPSDHTSDMAPTS